MSVEFQDHCDRLYAMATSSEGAGLVGKTTQQIADVLGPPDQISTLVRRGITWMRVVYVCQRLPQGASAEERDAYTRGWRFAPSLLFRDGILVTESEFYREVPEARLTATPSTELTFEMGGTFP
jgi:hypothetical protein